MKDLSDPKESMTVQIPMDQLEYDREYRIEINAVSTDRQALTGDQP